MELHRKLHVHLLHCYVTGTELKVKLKKLSCFYCTTHNCWRTLYIYTDKRRHIFWASGLCKNIPECNHKCKCIGVCVCVQYKDSFACVGVCRQIDVVTEILQPWPAACCLCKHESVVIGASSLFSTLGLYEGHEEEVNGPAGMKDGDHWQWMPWCDEIKEGEMGVVTAW